jgi:phospholipid/cholesterol/gamma-HCH transport system permease protein
MTDATTASLELEREDGAVRVRLSGDWKLGARLPPSDEVFAGGDPRRVAFDTGGLSAWDTGLVAFVVQVVQRCEGLGVEADRSGLPEGVRRLLDLALAVPEKKTGKVSEAQPLLARIGQRALDAWEGGRDMVAFLGESTLSLGRLLRGKARFRGSDLLLAIQECGPEALGIVSLISFLIGLILAFMGAIQLQIFGAEIYVADLVAIGMAREMAPMMTGIVMAGRTGAAYAAQLGTMTVNEEIDSLRTLGFSPMDFLVLPRMLALMLMMPILTVYSNLLGILGGFLVGTGMLGITPALYWNRTTEAAGLDDFTVGLAKAGVIGVLVAVAGCMRGMQCGRSASAVGLAATSAVVTGIVAIIVSEAVFAVLLNALGI